MMGSRELARELAAADGAGVVRLQPRQDAVAVEAVAAVQLRDRLPGFKAAVAH